MRSKKSLLLPKTKRILAELGENIRLARRRRRLTATQVAERANITRATLYRVEKGSPQVAMGTYVQVLGILGLAKDLKSVALDDRLGRTLQDAKLAPRSSSTKK